jgi:predicted permease
MFREWQTQTWLRLKALLKRRQLDRDLDDEIAFHLAMREEKISSGNLDSPLKSEDAHYSARRRFGNTTSLKEVTREMWTFASLETLWQDIRYGLRMLRKSRGFTAAAILTLALGIGANTAIFSVVNAVLLRPLPFRDPNRLVSVLEKKPAQNLDWLFVTPLNYSEWQKRTNTFEELTAVSGFNCPFRLASQDEPHLLDGSCATSNFLPMLGVQPMLGRLWTPQEDLPGAAHVAVLSYSLWKTQFGADPNAIGKTLTDAGNTQSFTIIGVLPPDFQFASEDTAVWAPLDIDLAHSARFHDLLVFARLKPGIAREQAQVSMDGIATQLEKSFPVTNTGWGVTVQPLQDFYSNRGNTRTTLLVMLAAVGALLLIACANVANLLLARAAVRQKEVAVRVAIGATRFRLVRQMLTESLLLGILGSGAGFLLAWAVFRPLISIAPAMPSFQPNAFRIDAQVLFYTMAAGVIASVLFGLAPALKISKQDLNSSLREAGRGLHGSIRDRATRHLLIVAEIALAFVLVVGTGLLIESFWNLQRDKLGFNSERVLTVNMCCLDASRYSTQTQFNAFYRQLFANIQSLPGVESVSSTTALPLRKFDGSGSVLQIQGRPAASPGHELLMDSRFVNPDYFHTMQIGLLRGRTFTAEDDENHPFVAIINESMARHLWPNQDPVGQQIKFAVAPANAWYRIIGVVANSRDRGLGKETRSTMYGSSLQTQLGGANLLIRTKSDPHGMVSSIRDVARALDHHVSITNPRTLDEAMSESLSPQRFSVLLLTLFAALALCLACIGVYGVTAFTVAQRTHEIGVRIALGAQPRDLFFLVVGQGLRLALVGVGIGIIGSLALTRLMSSLFFNVSAHDPLTLISVCAVLTAVTVLACYIPARRAMRVDPMIALRHD